MVAVVSASVPAAIRSFDFIKSPLNMISHFMLLDVEYCISDYWSREVSGWGLAIFNCRLEMP
jgi:hypothetical protein